MVMYPSQASCSLKPRPPGSQTTALGPPLPSCRAVDPHSGCMVRSSLSQLQTLSSAPPKSPTAHLHLESGKRSQMNLATCPTQVFVFLWL